MTTIKVIVAKPDPQVGFVGQEITVKRGYARNFLIPQGKVVELNSRNARMAKHQRDQIEKQMQKARSEAEDYKTKLSSTTLKFKLKTGDDSGKFFGSVAQKDILTSLHKEGFTDIVRKQVILPEALKSQGDHKVQVKLHTDVVAEITINVESQKAKKVAEEKPKKVAKKSEESEDEALDAPVTADDSGNEDSESNDDGGESVED